MRCRTLFSLVLVACACSCAPLRHPSSLDPETGGLLNAALKYRDVHGHWPPSIATLADSDQCGAGWTPERFAHLTIDKAGYDGEFYTVAYKVTYVSGETRWVSGGCSAHYAPQRFGVAPRECVEDVPGAGISNRSLPRAGGL